MGMSITETLRVQTLERQVAELPELKARIEALEAKLGSEAPGPTSAAVIPEGLRIRNATRRANADRLHAAIAAILANSTHPDALTAKEVVRALEAANFVPLRGRRTIAEHLARLRGRGSTCDATECHRND